MHQNAEMSFTNFYNYLDCEQKFEYRVRNYTSTIINYICEMFVIPELTELQKCTLMNIILTNGSCLIDTRNGKINLVGGHYYGVPSDGEILPDNYLAVKPLKDKPYNFDANPREIDGVTVAYINPFLAPCTEIQRFAVMLADVDTSLVNNVMFCRIAPIGCVQDDATKKTYENACNRMFNGELINSIKTYIDQNTGSASNLATIDISNGDYANKIQYLSMFHEQLLSRLCKMFGVPYNVLSKSANITTDELGNIDTFSSILPTNMKKCLQESIEPLGWHVEFSPVCKWIDNIEEMNTGASGDVQDSQTNEPTDNEPAPTPTPDEKE